jgi:hypothetical protein
MCPMPEFFARTGFSFITNDSFDHLDLFLYLLNSKLPCLSRAPLELNLLNYLTKSSFNVTYLDGYGCISEGTHSSAFPASVLPVTFDNKLVSTEFIVSYRRHVLQQAGY